MADEVSELGEKLVTLLDGDSMSAIGAALSQVMGTVIARAELDLGKGQRTMELFKNSIDLLGPPNIKKMQELKADPQKFQEFTECMTALKERPTTKTH